jgi:hypothetical protein
MTLYRDDSTIQVVYDKVKSVETHPCVLVAAKPQALCHASL